MQASSKDDSKNKTDTVNVSFRLPVDLYSKVQAQIQKQGEEELPHPVIYLLGLLYAYDLPKTAPDLAFEIVAVAFSKSRKSKKMEKLLRRFSRKPLRSKSNVGQARD